MQKGQSTAQKKAPIKRFLIIFSIITIITITLAIVLTSGPKTWHAIREMRLIYLLYALLLGMAMISINSVIIMILSAATGTKIGFLYAVETILSYYFFSSITPTVSGGEPIMIYMLTRKKVPLGKATSIALIRGVLVLLVIAIAAPIIIYFQGDLIQNEYLRKAFYTIAAFISVVIVVIAYAFINPEKVEGFIHNVTKKISRLKFLSRRVESLENKLDTWIEDFVKCFKVFLKYKKKRILAVVFLTIVCICTNYLIAYAILMGLGFYMSPVEVVLIQFVLYFLLYFAPTPGGAGVAEGGSFLMFAAYVPTHILGVFVILWRFFTAYLWLVLGGVFITKALGLNIVTQIPVSKKCKNIR